MVQEFADGECERCSYKVEMETSFREAGRCVGIAPCGGIFPFSVGGAVLTSYRSRQRHFAVSLPS